MDSVASSHQNPVAKSSDSVVSIDQNPPQTLVSSVGDPNLELPFSDKNNGNNNDGNGNNQETLGLNNNGFSNDEVFKPETGLNNDNGNGNQKTDNGLSKDENGLSNLEKDCSGREEETSSKRRRRKSRWDNDDVASEEGGKGGRKKKSRWADDAPPVPQLPDFLMNLTGSLEFDPEIQVLNSRLLEINRMLLSGLPLEDRPEGARSPSPEPIYDVKGIRINTRENRAKERLGREKQEIIQQMIKKNPAFRPPADYRPPKVHKKLYIPLKEYPGYNFIGLIIGPRGNTQKRMEKETGAKIVIRGKGSIKEGRINQKRDLKFDSAENEDLHVLVEADTQEAVDAAAGMVQKLLQPVDEVLNEHKRQQLRELAALNGTIKDEEFCRLCGEQGHRQFACPSRFSTFKSDVLCKICGDGGHPTIDCPVKGTTGRKMDDEYQNFLAELGGSMPEGLTKPSSNTLAIGPGNGNSTTEMGVNGVKQVKEIDETNLYIGYLPPTLEDDGLMRLFSPFGTIVNAKVVKDKVTGLSKGYGFVKYTNIQEANTAISSINGQRIDGRTIAVRVAGKVPTPVAPPAPPTSSAAHTYPVPNQSVSAYTPPANGYAPAPVPWGPPVVQPYGTYLTPPPPSPPPGSTMYTPYGVQYPPPMAVSSGPMSSQAVSSVGETQYPPGVQSLSSVQPLYTTPSFTYAPYYGGAPQQANTTYVSQTAMGQSQSFANVPWASSESVPPPSVATQKTTPGNDTEYEKFMAEMN